MSTAIPSENTRPAFVPQPLLDTPPAPVTPTRTRIDSIDLLRGIVMVIMMLDHTRDFVHSAGFLFDPTDLTRTTPALFFTRWITHFCSPVFVFLAGTGAYLQQARGKSKQELSRFLVKRGLWLIALEFTVVRLGAFFSLDYRFVGFLQVIWVIGVSMIVLAALIRLPLKVITGFGIAMVFLHNLLDRFQVMGGIATVLFVILRAINLYGDPARWSPQKNSLFTLLSFLNTTKYPPSLLFLLMTLGPALVALTWFEINQGFASGFRNALIIFGRVPLFFYLLQWYTAHLIAVIVGLLAGQSVGWQFESPIDRFSHPPPPGVGFRLWVVYICWIIGVLLLYPICKWFAGVKARRKDWWLSYL